MRSILVDAIIMEARKFRVWKWIAYTSIMLHIFRSL